MQYAIEDIDSERLLVIPNIPMNFMALVFNNSLAGSLITLLRPRLSALRLPHAEWWSVFGLAEA